MNGSSTATPIDGITGQLCPEGSYCLQGTPVPSPCPLGTWTNSTGLRLADECTPCLPGYYCADTGLSTPSGPCAARYYCSGNASTATPNDGGVTGAPCTVGHYCPEGTPDPIPCPHGTYMNETHADACWTCTAGYYCVAGLIPQLCPPGYYCPAGTGIVWESCPRGTFSTQTGLANATQCTPCLGGYYCGETNATTITGECTAGYYCTEGSDTPTPDVNYQGTAGPCPTGHYCAVRTTTPTPCPVGYFSNQTHNQNESDCSKCSYGQYCGSTGLSSPTADCWAGFYCLEGAQSPNNPTLDDTGGPCPVGHYCPNGTSYPLGCNAGTYSASTGAAECTPCPAGYYCLENSTSYASSPCSMGHYCPLGTGNPTQYPCDKGYFNNYTGRSISEKYFLDNTYIRILLRVYDSMDYI